jgi:hypothetical protein
MTDNEAPRLTAKDLEKAIEKLKKNGVGVDDYQVVLPAQTVYHIYRENERLTKEVDAMAQELKERRAVMPLMAQHEQVSPTTQPDPKTGLVPCGCGGVVEQEDFHDGFFPYSRVTCRGCWTETTRCRCTTEEAHEMERIGWNASHGYTAPPRPGAIGPETGEMDPNGDEGAE